MLVHAQLLLLRNAFGTHAVSEFLVLFKGRQRKSLQKHEVSDFRALSADSASYLKFVLEQENTPYILPFCSFQVHSSRYIFSLLRGDVMLLLIIIRPML